MINNDVKTECTEKTIWKLMAEIERLNKENENLRIENVQIKADRDEWKDGFKLLHNMMENQKENATVVDGGNDLSYIDEYAKGNSKWDNFSLKELDWNIAQ